MAEENKTKPGQVSVSAFLGTLDEQKRADSERLIEIMRGVTNHEPVMWGASIIGFDTHHYRYDSGREGDICAIGFSPRKASLTVYINEGFDAYGDLLEKLGDHTTSVSCLYLKKLSDVDESVLRELINRSYAHNRDSTSTKTVDDYVSSVPVVAKKHFDELRTAVLSTLPDAEEVVSYGILGYKPGGKRAVVYISGWKDHVALYPVPRTPELHEALQPYIKGKGTLWFGLEKPLPTALIQEVIEALRAEQSR